MEATLSDSEFRNFQGLIHERAGIHLPPAKMTLVRGRLAKRLRARALASYDEYYRLISDDGEAQELQTAINLLTTNETYFFREPGHFEFLAREVLPGLALAAGVPFRVWSAASSSGEEAYSIAMVLMDKLGETHPWEVFGSDISTAVLERARTAIYPTARTEGIPADYRRRFCLRGTGGMADKLRIDAQLRGRVRFAQMNLNEDLSQAGIFDVIFLRNVLIYFDNMVKKAVIDRLYRQLRSGGWLIIGHSESLNGIEDRLKPLRPTLYRKELRS
ncbi:chemotaxis protein methyltransferase [mine drainage metagenome]|uniref:protein-glutamate O-methyltransferase n=1 Tax=mine drainage metagenome TaxID=410659 RepID=A0A1J5S555_9ZZZZ